MEEVIEQRRSLTLILHLSPASSGVCVCVLATAQHEGKSTVLEVDEYTSILDAALDNDIELPHDCKLGVCLTCPSVIVSGDVDQSDGTLEDSVTAQVGWAGVGTVIPLSTKVSNIFFSCIHGGGMDCFKCW